jgi:hypothetical protein
MTARRLLLDGLARDADIFEVLSGLAPLHPPNDTFPGEVFLSLAADALEWCGASRAEPLPLEGLRERFLSETAFRGRQNAKLQYAVLAAAAVRGGAEPDLLDEVASWQTDDFWQYAMYAAVAYIRGAASRAGVPGAAGMSGPRRAARPPGAIARLRTALWRLLATTLYRSYSSVSLALPSALTIIAKGSCHQPSRAEYLDARDSLRDIQDHADHRPQLGVAT